MQAMQDSLVRGRPTVQVDYFLKYLIKHGEEENNPLIDKGQLGLQVFFRRKEPPHWKSQICFDFAKLLWHWHDKSFLNFLNGKMLRKPFFVSARTSCSMDKWPKVILILHIVLVTNVTMMLTFQIWRFTWRYRSIKSYAILTLMTRWWRKSVRL